MPSSLTITSTDFTTFSANTIIQSSKVNNNFNIFRGHVLPVDASASSAADATYDLGSTDYRFRQGHFSGTVSAAEFSGDFTGRIVYGLTTLAGAATLSTTAKVVLCSNASTASYTITLPSATSMTGNEILFKRTDETASSIILDGNGSETIDNTLTVSLGGGRSVRKLISDGSNWNIIDKEILRNSVYVTTGNGHGSSNTTIRRYSATIVNIGSAVTYSDSAANGASFTINEDGIYFIQISDARAAGGAGLGISLNGSSLSTAIQSLANQDERLGFCSPPGSGAFSSVSWSGPLNDGDIIRPHTDSTIDGATLAAFRIAKVRGV